jgi:pimeloyl-ACP methyl ester carboxylesterase
MTNPLAVLIHSGGFTSRQWRKLGETLAPDFRVVAPDLVGLHFREDVRFVESLIDNQPVHLVGHSYGGFVALHVALANPKLVRSIAVYDPVAFAILDPVEDADALLPLQAIRREWQPGANGSDDLWLESFVDWWNGRGAWTHLPEETRAAFRAVGWIVFNEVMSLTTDATDRATWASIDAPALILGGAKSPLSERRVVQRLGEVLPRATVQSFADVGHMGPISHAPLVNAAIASHLRANS